MRVLRLTPSFDWPAAGAGPAPPGYNAVGGLQAQVVRQSAALAQLGVEQTILTWPMPGAPRALRMGDRVEVEGVRGLTLAAPGREPGVIRLHLSWIDGVRRRLRGARGRWDLVHVHGTCVPWPLIAGLRARATARAPLVITVHCSILATYRPVSRRDAAFQRVARAVERRGVGAAAHTMVLTERVRDRLLGDGLAPAGAVSVVPDAIDVAALAAADRAAGRAFGERHGVPPEAPVVAYLGRISHEKGWPALVELAARLAGSGGHVLAIGGGGEEDALRAELERRGLRDALTITGLLPEGEVPAALARAGALVLPSNFEELGSAALEGMAAGLPVVAYDVGGVAEAVLDGETGMLVAHGDVDALAAAVARLLDDPDLARRLGARGREVAAGRYDVSAVARRILGVYGDVLARR